MAVLLGVQIQKYIYCEMSCIIKVILHYSSIISYDGNHVYSEESGNDLEQ